MKLAPLLIGLKQNQTLHTPSTSCELEGAFFSTNVIVEGTGYACNLLSSVQTLTSRFVSDVAALMFNGLHPYCLRGDASRSR